VGWHVREAVGVAAGTTLTECPGQSHSLIGHGAIPRAIKSIVSFTFISLLSVGSAGAAGNPLAPTTTPTVGSSEGLQVAQRQSCKAATTCQEAVEMWCGGYGRADADGDGIPCENVCRSKSQVDKIKEEIGC
jgi:hypothetical protein